MASDKSFLWSPFEADKRGNAIANALEAGNDPTTNQDLANLMYVKNYTKKDAGARDNDLSREFSDAIIMAGAYHRALDDGNDLNVNAQAKNFVQKLVADADKLAYASRYFNLMRRTPAGVAAATPIPAGRFFGAVPGAATPSAWFEANWADAADAVANGGNYRLNLKKRSVADASEFGLALPLYKGFGGWWYTPGNRVDANGPEELLQEQIYAQVPARGDLVGLSLDRLYELQGKPTLLSVKVSENVRRSLFAIAQAKVADVSEVPTDYGDYADLCDGNRWHCDDNGFYTMVNGQKIAYGAEDPASVALLKQEHMCYSSGVKGDSAQCNQYIFECLLDNKDGADLDLAKCIQNYDAQGNFFDVAKQEIDNMHPIIAVRTLQKFGFRTHQVYDSQAGMQLKKVEDVNHWLRNFVDKKFDAAKAQAVRSQSKLLHYLGMLVSFVNANCGILNKGVQATTEEAAGIYKPSEYIQKLGIEPRRTPTTDSASFYYDMQRFRPHFEQYRQARTTPFKMGNRGLFTPFGGMISPGAQVLVQSGGGAQGDMVLRKLQSNCSGAYLIGQILNSVKNALGARGKQLCAADVQKLEEKVRLLLDTEKELLKTINYIEEYNRLMDIYRDYSVSELNVAELERFVKRHSHLKDKQVAMEEYLLRILEKLGKVADEDDDLGKMSRVGIDCAPGQRC